VVDHELGEPLAVERHDAPVPPTFRPGACLPGGASGGDEHPLVDAVAEECAGEGLQLPAADAVVLAVALGPEVDGIEAEGVLVDHAVDAAVAAAPDPHAAAAGAVAHGEQQLHHELLEGRRREGAEAPQQFLGEGRGQFRRRRVDAHFGRFSGSVVSGGASFAALVFVPDRSENLAVEALRIPRRHLTPAFGDRESATTRAPHRSFLTQPDDRPVDAIGGHGRSSAPQGQAAFFVARAERVGDPFDGLGMGGFALLGGEAQDWQIRRLDTGNRHGRDSAVAKGHG